MTPCIDWQKYRTPDGYGQLKFERKIVYAHRIAYVKAHDLSLSDIDGLVVRHKCDRPCCINPDHLEIGTIADNNRDMWQRGRANVKPPKGEKHWHARLTDADVFEIRRLSKSALRQGEIGQKFGVSRSTITLIVAGKTWRHLL